MRKLKVMPDFMSSGIWNMEWPDKRGLMIGYENLKISKNLIKEFEAWIRYYDTCFKSDYSTFKKNKSKKLNDWGRQLATKLKKELPTVHVEYVGEDEMGIFNPEEIKKCG
jgi:hypothetical protein